MLKQKVKVKFVFSIMELHNIKQFMGNTQGNTSEFQLISKHISASWNLPAITSHAPELMVLHLRSRHI